MSWRTTKFIVDTQLFIDAVRDHDAKQAFQQFRNDFSPFEYFSVVVAQELRAGIRTAAERRMLERHTVSPFERANRIVTPSADAWHRSGDTLAAMAATEGLGLARVSKAFANDVLIAASCREAGCVLITGNTRDFSRIRRFMPFHFVAPWPGSRRATFD